MAVTEKNFPRGGKKPKIGFNDKKKFDFLASSDKIGKKKRYKPKVIKENVLEEDLDHLSDASSEAGENIKAISAEKISIATLREGMVVLGRISSIHDTKLTVMLPGRLTGHVMASHISTPYIKILQSYINDEVEDIKKLNEFFKIGEYVNVSISSITKQDNGKTHITLSLMPQDINKGLVHSNVSEGILLRGALESKEDHGYVIDLGISNCRTFLPQKFVDSTLQLDIGQVIWCVVKKCQKSSTNSIITVSNLLEHLNSTHISQNKIQNFTINDLRPGMPINFFVNKPLKDGAEGLVLTDIMGYIHLSQIKDKLHTGKTVKAFLLYVMPVTKFPFFTTREVFETYEPNVEKEAPLKPGQIIENATVIKLAKTSMIFKIEGGIAIMPKSFSQASKLEDENVSKYYSTGTKHTIRIMSYHLSDYAYICTDKEDILEVKYFTLNDLKAGDLVEATVFKSAEKGIIVNVNKLRAWIPDLHMSDIGLYQSSKGDNKFKSIIFKKFQIGQKISTRVLKVDPSKNQLHLTAKSSLLSPDLKILKSIEDAEVGHQYKGVIVYFLPIGAVVSFFGDVTANVHRSDMSSEKIKNVRDAFNIGQVVNCWIKSVDLVAKRIKVSFRQIEIPDVDNKNKNETNMNDVKADSTNSIETSLERKNKKSKKGAEELSNDEISLKKKKKKSKKIEEELNNEISLGKKKEEELINEEISSEKKDKKSKKRENEINNVEISSGKKNKKSKKMEVEPTIEEISSVKKNKKSKKSEEEPTNVEILPEENNKKSKKRKKELDNEAKPQKKAKVDLLSMQNFWDLDASIISKNLLNKTDDLSSSDSEEETVEEKTKKKKKKLTNTEKVERAIQDEEKLRDIENKLTATDSKPQSSDQFDRLLLADPNNSELWIAYMAFHLQATEIERARAIAKKALNTISFREENDKLNVWLALLNLENRFGTKESLNITLQDALQMNERYQIHSKMLDMYAETGKVNELSTLIDTMLAKYKSNPDMYVDVGQVCYKFKMVEKARAAMQKAISRLENKKHVPILIKFANMENSNGDTERAETIFEQIVGCMPLRVDVWCVYIDMLTKNGKTDNARLIFERATAQKLSVKKMKTLYKKWIEMEETFGDSESVEIVRKTAVEYIKRAQC